LTEEIQGPETTGDQPGTAESERLATLEKLIAEKENLIADLEAKLTLTRNELTQSVASYRAAALRLNPEIQKTWLAARP
jgi:uncharacterized coiled-coil protein SlyX